MPQPLARLGGIASNRGPPRQARRAGFRTHFGPTSDQRRTNVKVGSKPVNDLTRRFAETALKRWPQRPAFVYLDAAARFGAEPWRMPERDRQRLDQVFEQAQDQGDQRTAARVSKLLDASGAGRFGSDDLPPDLGDLGPGGVRGVMEMMLAIGGEDSFFDMARAQLGKASFDQLRRDIKGSKKQFALALIELLAIAEPEPLPPIRILPPNRPPERPPDRPPNRPPTRPAPPTPNTYPGLFDD